MRNDNFENIIAWNKYGHETSQIWEPEKYYTLENKLSWSYYSNTDVDIIEDFAQWESELMDTMQSYKMCLDDQQRYIYDCPVNSNNSFYRYLFVSKVSYKNDDGTEETIEDALIFTSKVIWYKGGYHETEISIILTDWQRL